MTATQKEIMILLRDELDVGDELTDLSLACDALMMFYSADDVIAAFNLTCNFLNHKGGVCH